MILVPTGTPVNFLVSLCFKINVASPSPFIVTSVPSTFTPPSVFLSVPAGNTKFTVKLNSSEVEAVKLVSELSFPITFLEIFNEPFSV